MKKPISVCATGLGHPEGPYELDDGRIIYANTYASAIGVWDPKTGVAGVYADVGGGPNACMLGSDGHVYSTQTPTVGKWVAPVHRPPSIQKTSPDRKGGSAGHRSRRREVRRPERSHFRSGRTALFHGFRRLGARDEAASWAHRCRRGGRQSARPRRTRSRLPERHRRRAGRVPGLGRNRTRSMLCGENRTDRSKSSTRCRTDISPTV